MAGGALVGSFSQIEWGGLFEYCERLLEQGLLNRTDFDRNLRTG
jgi:hypothetical protein